MGQLSAALCTSPPVRLRDSGLQMGICSSEDKQPTQQDSMAQSHGADEIEGPLINLQMTAPARCNFQIKGEDTVGSLLAMVAREMQSEPGNLQIKLSKSKGAPVFLCSSEAGSKLFHAGFQDGSEFTATDLFGGGNTDRQEAAERAPDSQSLAKEVIARADARQRQIDGVGKAADGFAGAAAKY